MTHLIYTFIFIALHTEQGWADFPNLPKKNSSAGHPISLKSPPQDTQKDGVDDPSLYPPATEHYSEASEKNTPVRSAKPSPASDEHTKQGRYSRHKIQDYAAKCEARIIDLWSYEKTLSDPKEREKFQRSIGHAFDDCRLIIKSADLFAKLDKYITSYTINIRKAEQCVKGRDD